MELLLNIVNIIFNSMGMIIFSTSVAGAVYNQLSHRRLIADISTGITYGLFSNFFIFIPLILNNNKIMDFRFILLLIAVLIYNLRVTLFMLPLYLFGLYISGYSVLIGIFSAIYCLIIGMLKFKGNTKFLLTFCGLMPIVFSEPLIYKRIDVFDGKLLFTLSIFIILVVLVFSIALTSAAKRNVFGGATLIMYAKSLAGRYNNIYHFVINRDKTKVRFSKRFYDEFELSGISQNIMSFNEFANMFKKSLVMTNETSERFTDLLNGRGKNLFFITPKTETRKYIYFICRKNLWGYYSGQILDETEKIEPEEMLHETLTKDHLTGFKTYYVMKEEMVEHAKLGNLILQIHMEISFSQRIESLYGFEFEKKCIRFFAERLDKAYPEAYKYFIRENEIEIIFFNVEKSEYAKKYSDEIFSLFSKPFEIKNKKVIFTITAGVLISEALKCDSIEKADSLIAKAMYAKNMAYKKSPGSVHFFKESEYEEFIEQNKRAEILHNLILKGEFFSVFQPIVDAKNAEVFAYEVLTRVKNETYKSTTQLIKDSYQFGLDKDLDIAIIKGIKNKLTESEISHNLFINKLPSTPIITEFGAIAEHLKKYDKTLYVEIAEYEESDIDNLIFYISRLTSKGIKIAIDDYGAVYSSQSMVSIINPSVIKIDMTLINDINNNKHKEIMVKGIVEYCNTMGIKCLAEGISNKDELRMIIKLGVHYLQGYYLGMPEENPKAPSESVKKEILMYRGAVNN